MITRICTKCGEEKSLEEFSRTNHNKIGRQPKCKECTAIYSKEYRKNNKEKIEKQNKLYRNNNKEKIKTRCAEWYENNKEHVLERSRKWKQDNISKKLETDRKWRRNNPDKSNIIRKKVFNKRKRNFGFTPLNEKFPGSVGHHISKDLVIFIPEELHKSIPHRYDDPISMGEINGLALEFMMPEVG